MYQSSKINKTAKKKQNWLEKKPHVHTLSVCLLL